MGLFGRKKEQREIEAKLERARILTEKKREELPEFEKKMTAITDNAISKIAALRNAIDYDIAVEEANRLGKEFVEELTNCNREFRADWDNEFGNEMIFCEVFEDSGNIRKRLVAKYNHELHRVDRDLKEKFDIVD